MLYIYSVDLITEVYLDGDRIYRYGTFRGGTVSACTPTPLPWNDGMPWPTGHLSDEMNGSFSRLRPPFLRGSSTVFT